MRLLRPSALPALRPTPRLRPKARARVGLPLGGGPDDAAPQGGGAPGIARLHYRVLDAQGTVLLDDYQTANGTTPATWQTLQVGLRLPQAGSVQLSVETNGAAGPTVYFDDVAVEQTGGLIVQEQHQYAFGAPLPGLSYTVGSTRYRHGYQGQFADKDEETGFDSFELRLYNSRIGRWMAPDPYGQFDSPYVDMGNNPVMGVDPDGGLFGPGPWSAGASLAKLGEVINTSYLSLGSVMLPNVLVTGSRIGLGTFVSTASNIGSVLNSLKHVGAPGPWESAIPVWGSGREAINDFQTGHYVWGTVNTAMAISDVFLVKAVFTGAGRIAAKTAWKTGVNNWKATRSWIGRRGLARKGQQVHHWLLHRNQGIGKYAPDWLKNQPWNLMNMENNYIHSLIHGMQGEDAFNLLEKVYHGTPQWFKAATGSLGGRAAEEAIR